MSYHGADKVVDNYNVMGPVKAALQASVRYLAKELGPQGIRVFAVSPGPLRTRAASGIAHFDELIDMAVTRSPGQRLVDIAEVGRVVAFLAGPASSRHDRRRGLHRRRPAQHGLTPSLHHDQHLRLFGPRGPAQPHLRRDRRRRQREHRAHAHRRRHPAVRGDVGRHQPAAHRRRVRRVDAASTASSPTACGARR